MIDGLPPGFIDDLRGTGAGDPAAAGRRQAAATALLSVIFFGPAASGGRVNVSASTSSRRPGQRSISSRDPSGLAAIPDGIFGSTILST